MMAVLDCLEEANTLGYSLKRVKELTTFILKISNCITTSYPPFSETMQYIAKSAKVFIFCSNPSSTTFVSLEELFLNLDDELFTKRRRGEQANYIHGQPQKQDMSKVNSFFVVKWDTISATAPKPNSKAIITTIYLI